MRIKERDLRRIINEVVSEALGHEERDDQSRDPHLDKIFEKLVDPIKFSKVKIINMCKEVMEFNSDNAMNCLDLIASCCASEEIDLDMCYSSLSKICECKGCKMICMRHCELGN